MDYRSPWLPTAPRWCPSVAQGAAGLAVALRSKNNDTKQMALSAGITGVLGIAGVGRYASGSPGLLVLPACIGGDSMTNFVNACIGTVIAMVVSFVVCFVLYGVWQKQGKLEEGE